MSLNDDNPYGDFNVPGCMDSKALNYDENATEDDGTCRYPEINKEVKPLPIEDCNDLKKVYQKVIISIILAFLLILLLILVNKNKNKINDNVSDENPFVIYLN